MNDLLYWKCMNSIMMSLIISFLFLFKSKIDINYRILSIYVCMTCIISVPIKVEKDINCRGYCFYGNCPVGWNVSDSQQHKFLTAAKSAISFAVLNCSLRNNYHLFCRMFQVVIFFEKNGSRPSNNSRSCWSSLALTLNLPAKYNLYTKYELSY